MKKFLSFLVASALTAGISTSAFAADINVTVDGTPVQWTDAAPFINEDSRTLVPLRPIANALGLTVTWDAEAKQAIFSQGSMDAIFTIDHNICQISSAFGESNVQMDTEAVIANGRTYAPARYLAEVFGYTVGWDNATKSVTISSDPADIPQTSEEVIFEAPPEEEDPVFTLEAGMILEEELLFTDITFLEDADHFEPALETDTELEFLSYGFEYTYLNEGRMPIQLQPVFDTVPGEYPVTLTLPAEWIADAEEPMTVSIILDVTEPTLDTVLNVLIAEVENGVFAPASPSADDVVTAILESTEWLLYDTAFTLEIGEGIFDESTAEWTGTFTVTDGTNSLSEEVTIAIKNLDAFLDEFED